MSTTVKKGDILVIPAPNQKNKNDSNKIGVHWQQWFQQKDANYYVLIARNKTRNNDKVPFYIQAEWYNTQGFNDARNLKKINDETYELTVDDRLQYGATNSWNEFVVWHDKDRKPFAERFVNKGFLTSGTDKAAELLGAFSKEAASLITSGTPGALAQKIDVITGAYTGVPLKTF